MNPTDKPALTLGDLLAEVDRLRDHVLDRVNVMLQADLPPERRAEVLTRRFQRASSALSVLGYAADTLREAKTLLDWVEDEIAGRPHRDEVRDLVSPIAMTMALEADIAEQEKAIAEAVSRLDARKEQAR